MLLNASSAVSLIDVEPTCSQRSVPRSDSGILHRRRLPSFLTSSWSKKNDNIIENLYLCQSSLQVSRAPHFHDPSFNFFLSCLLFYLYSLYSSSVLNISDSFPSYCLINYFFYSCILSFILSISSLRDFLYYIVYNYTPLAYIFGYD